MIDTFLIKDTAHYDESQLDAMQKAIAKNFMLSTDAELDARFKSNKPEIRIYFKLLHGILPVMLFRALGDDLLSSMTDNFLNAFLNPNSKDDPSIIVEFAGGNRSIQLRVKSGDAKTIKEGVDRMIERVLGVIAAEHAQEPKEPESHSFSYENGDWV